MTDQVERIVLTEVDKYEFIGYLDSELEGDNVSESCYTNFEDILVKTVIKSIHETVDTNGWKLRYFEKNYHEKIFKAFMENGEIKILLKKKINESKNMFKKVTIKFDFPADEKKRIAKSYITNILEAYGYLDLCIFINLEEINADTISEALSNEVDGLLTPDEIKTEFKDKIEDAINIINDDIDIDDNDIDE
jgi:hypothetical protein